MVTIYSKNNCVQCKMTKRFLDTNHVKDLGFNAAPVIQTATEAFSGFQPGKLKKLS